MVKMSKAAFSNRLSIDSFWIRIALPPFNPTTQVHYRTQGPTQQRFESTMFHILATSDIKRNLSRH